MGPTDVAILGFMIVWAVIGEFVIRGEEKNARETDRRIDALETKLTALQGKTLDEPLETSRAEKCWLPPPLRCADCGDLVKFWCSPCRKLVHVGCCYESPAAEAEGRETLQCLYCDSPVQFWCSSCGQLVHAD